MESRWYCRSSPLAKLVIFSVRTVIWEQAERLEERSILLEGRMSTRSSTTSTTRPNRYRMLLFFIKSHASFGGVRVRRRWARKKPTALAANTK